MTDASQPAPTSPAAATHARTSAQWLERAATSDDRPRRVDLRLAFGVLFPSPVAPEVPWIVLLVWGVPGAVVVLGSAIMGGEGGVFLACVPGLLAGYGTFTMMIERADVARGWRALRALRWGEPLRATWLRSEPSGVEVNGEEILTHTFLFVTPNGQEHTVIARGGDPPPREDVEQLALYVPSSPDDAVLLASIPGDPRPTDRGTVEATTPGVTWGTIAVAGLAAATWIFALGGSVWQLLAGGGR